jgi:hypothetical protein
MDSIHFAKGKIQWRVLENGMNTHETTKKTRFHHSHHDLKHKVSDQPKKKPVSLIVV